MSARGDDYRYLARAIRLARRGLATTDPNPRVGTVLVKDGRIVGEGWHAHTGGPHAERVALEAAGASARGATAYVTLEPCSHEGRTGPCTNALIEAGVARVVCASVDPFPEVAGRGLEALEAAGIEVEVGLLADAAAELNPGYLARMRRGRPWVRLKLAASLDGRTALANGESRWITGPAARADVHRYRARSSAILTGSGTVLADDPALTVRLAGEPAPVRAPWRVVVDAGLRIPPHSRVLDRAVPTLLFTLATADPERRHAVGSRARIETVPGEIHCDLGAVLRRLGELEQNEVWVEAGPGLSGALLAAGLVDELVIYLAPQLLGDAARGMFALGELKDLDARVRLENVAVRRLGDDLRITARPSNVAGP